LTNSAAVIGTPTVSTVTEDANQQILTAAGSISIADANVGQAAFKTTVIAAPGDLGSLNIAANGAYVYSVADSKVQYLGAGDTKVDTFTVTSLDGTQKQVSFTIVGVNDTAVIGTPTVTDVTEDAASPTLKATGSISISDVDQNQAAFKTAVISAVGDLGTLVLQSNGSYTYSVADGAVQYLGAGQTKVDTFTVTSLDGTQKQISFTIHGTNDAAVIGTPTVHDVTEDATNPTLMAVGSISITDADQGQAAFKTTVASAAGSEASSCPSTSCPSMSTCGRMRSSQEGRCHARSPSSDITAGPNVMRTRKASIRTPKAKAKPIVLMIGSVCRVKPPKTLIMMTAAATTTRAP